MRLKTWLICLISSLGLSGCGHGLILNVCENDLVAKALDCQLPSSLFHHPKPTSLSYAQSDGYAAYPPNDTLAIYSYCAARMQSTTQAPNFYRCTSLPAQGGFECELQGCLLIPAGQGMTCTPVSGTSYFIPYGLAQGYMALSPTDNTGLYAFCNISESE